MAVGPAALREYHSHPFTTDRYRSLDVFFVRRQHPFDMLKIGPYELPNNLALAPMAGVADRPFRTLCHGFGAGWVVSEMLTSDTSLWNTRKSRLRLQYDDEHHPRTIQIAGGSPEMLAEAARRCADQGAQIIDINMGCPAKKVCNKAAGSALLRDEELVEQILHAVVQSVDIPVTLKFRTGWCPESRNALSVAKIAEAAGIQALTLHGRTRADGYRGAAEYETIKAVVDRVSLPVIANGDIDSPMKAKQVLEQTGAAGVMIGRAAQGQPWLFREVAHYLATGELAPAPDIEEIRATLIEHLCSLHQFYGDVMGVRIARKHVGWYLNRLTSDMHFRKQFNAIEDKEAQLSAIEAYFAQHAA